MFSVTDSSLELRNTSALLDTGCIWVFDDVEYAFTATLDKDLSSELYHVILIERVSLNTFARDTVRKISLARPYANARMSSCYVPAIFNDLTNTICLVFRVRYDSDTSQKPYRAELNQGRKLLFDISSLNGTVIQDDHDYNAPTDGRTFVISTNQSPLPREILNIDLPPYSSELKVGGLFVDGSTSIDWGFPAVLYDIRSGEIQSELPNFPEAITSYSDSRPYIVSLPASRRAVWLDWGNTGWEKLHYGMGGLLYDTKGDSIVHGFHAFGSKRDRMSAKTASDGTYSIVRLTDGQTILVHHPDHVAQLMQWKLHSTSISPNDEHVSSQPPQLPVSIATQSTVPLRVTQNGAWVVTVYDHLGRQEAQGSYETDDGLLEISTFGLPMGIHAIVAKQGGEVSRRMVMIEAP